MESIRESCKNRGGTGRIQRYAACHGGLGSSHSHQTGWRYKDAQQLAGRSNKFERGCSLLYAGCTAHSQKRQSQKIRTLDMVEGHAPWVCGAEVPSPQPS